jgi:integrase
MAERKGLNARSIATLRGPAVVFDSKLKGLEFRVTDAQAKSWSLRYRVWRSVDGKPVAKQRRLTLGAYPTLSLAAARQRAKDALQSVDDGHDPQQQKKSARHATSVDEFVERYIDEHAKPKKRSWKDDRRQFDAYVLPKWRGRRMVDIRIDDVEELLQTVAARGPIMANRTRALLHKFFKYAVQKRVVASNPVTGTERLGKETQRQRVLTDDEIRKLWTACDALPLARGAAFKVRLLTAQRGGEVANMRWSDLDFDNAVWTIPETDAKNKLAHRVP